MCPYHDLHAVEVEIGVLNQSSGRQGLVLPHLRRDHEADCGKKLKLRFSDPANAQESIEVIHGEAEDLRIAASVLAYFEHPVGHLLPRVRLDLGLHGQEVIPCNR